ncbi:hypothetical protein Y1Q_0024616 [Alligator mississippiensis]|uniref:Uncharacterized protein n=1 Tax=Alligator mississippiensis TaxID=8496 RepID=A0A151NB64_ALLMI|nr:hypothetical protein Y1Q_0024616 [Alligator mississippiensis]
MSFPTGAPFTHYRTDAELHLEIKALCTLQPSLEAARSGACCLASCLFICICAVWMGIAVTPTDLAPKRGQSWKMLSFENCDDR